MSWKNEAKPVAQQVAVPPKMPGRTYVGKTKNEGGDSKWKTHFSLFMREDMSQGVATIFYPDGTKLEKVTVFYNEPKEAGRGAPHAAARQ